MKDEFLKTIPQRILVVRTDRIGDVVLSLPVVDNLKRAFPKARICFMCSPLTQDIVLNYPGIDDVIIFDKKNRHKGVFGLLSLIFSIRKKNFDWAVVLHSTNSINIVVFLSGIPLRIGWARKMRWLLNRPLPYSKNKGEMHERDYNLEVLNALGVPIPSRNISVYPSKAAEEKMTRRLADHGVSENDVLVGIHPLSSCPSKMWPRARFETLALRLVRECGVKIAVIGGEKLSFSLEPAVQDMVLNFSGIISIDELIVLMSRCKVLVSNDSGPVHVAAGVKTPCVVIFGRNQKGLSPQRWGPLGARDQVLIKDAGCTQCLAHRCTKEFQCLKNISVEEVLSAVVPFLK